MKRLLLILLVLGSTAHAEIYRSQNEKGEWTYSDRPSPSAEVMKLPPLSTYTVPPAKPPAELPAPQEEAAVVYKSMQFIEPENNLTVRDLDSEVKVSVRLDPLLKTQRGHKIQYYLDDAPHGEPAVSSKLTLKNLERGAHTLGASVLDAEGKPIFSAAPVSFYVHRQSLNSPLRKTPPPKKK